MVGRSRRWSSVGQAPVRCRGAVEAGDTLVPSGLDDGCAVSAGEAAAVAAGMIAAVYAARGGANQKCL